MMRYETFPPEAEQDGAAYQSWLRRHIARLEEQQILRIDMHTAHKKAMDDLVEKCAREIADLKAQQTIRGV